MRVYVISDYPAVRTGLSTLVHDQPGWDVSGASEAAGTGLQVDDGDAPDVLLIDLDTAEGALPVETLATWIGTLRPRGGIVALGPAAAANTRAAADSSAFALDLMRAVNSMGVAAGVVRRDATVAEIVAAVASVASGLHVIDPRYAEALLASADRAAVRSHTTTGAEVEEPLTARESEVLQLLAEGLPNKLIATRLHMTEHTAKYHVSTIMTKLGAASRTEAVTVAARRGLLIL